MISEHIIMKLSTSLTTDEQNKFTQSLFEIYQQEGKEIFKEYLRALNQRHQGSFSYQLRKFLFNILQDAITRNDTTFIETFLSVNGSLLDFHLRHNDTLPNIFFQAVMNIHIFPDVLSLLLNAFKFNFDNIHVPYQGKTALQWAFDNYFLQELSPEEKAVCRFKIEMLIKKGAFLEIRRGNETISLLVELAKKAAASPEYWDLINFVSVTKEANTNYTNQFSQVLFLAVENRRFDIAIHLLDHIRGILIYSDPHTGYTALHLAILQNNLNFIHFLVAKIPEILNHQSETAPAALTFALTNADVSTFSLLVNFPHIMPESRYQQKTTLQWAMESCFANDLSPEEMTIRRIKFQLLIQRGASLLVENERGDSLIIDIVMRIINTPGYLNLIEPILMLNSHEEYSAEFSKALLIAVKLRSFDLAFILLNKVKNIGLSVNPDNAYNALHYAVIFNHVVLVKTLLAVIPELLTLQYINEVPPILLAAMNVSISAEIFHILLTTSKVNLEIKYQDKTLLQWILESYFANEKVTEDENNEREKKLCLALQQNASLAVKNSKKDTPVVGIARKAAAAMKVLEWLENPNKKDILKVEAYWDLLKLIVEIRSASKGDPEDYNYALFIAAQCERFDVATMLLNASPVFFTYQDNDSFFTALHYAIVNNKLDFIQLLLMKSPGLLQNLKKYDLSPLIVCVENDSVSPNTMAFLLEQQNINLELDHKEKTAVQYAMKKCFLTSTSPEQQQLRQLRQLKLRLLIENGASLAVKNSNGFSPLVELMLHTLKNPDFLSCLTLIANSKIPGKGFPKQFAQAITLAASQQRFDLAKILLHSAHPISYWGEEDSGYSAFHYAIIQNKLKFAARLLNKYPPILNYYKTDKPTPLILAVLNENILIKTLHFLLSQPHINIDIKYQDKSALEWIFEKCLLLSDKENEKRNPKAQLLIERGASLTVVDANGNTPVGRMTMKASENLVYWNFVSTIANANRSVSDEGNPEQAACRLLLAVRQKKFDIESLAFTDSMLPPTFLNMGFVALYHAVFANEIAFISALLNKSRAILSYTCENKPPVLIAAALCPEIEPDTLEYLLSQEDVNLQAIYLGNTALQWAIINNTPQEKLALFLINENLLNFPNAEGDLPIIQAAKLKHWHQVRRFASQWQVQSSTLEQLLILETPLQYLTDKQQHEFSSISIWTQLQKAGVPHTSLYPSDSFANQLAIDLPASGIATSCEFNRFILTPKQYLKFICQLSETEVAGIEKSIEEKKSVQYLSNREIAAFMKVISQIKLKKEEELSRLMAASENLPPQEILSALQNTLCILSNDISSIYIALVSVVFNPAAFHTLLELVTQLLPPINFFEVILDSLPLFFLNDALQSERQERENIRQKNSHLFALQAQLIAINTAPKFTDQNLAQLFIILRDNQHKFEEDIKSPVFKVYFILGWLLKRLGYQFEKTSLLEYEVQPGFLAIHEMPLQDLWIEKNKRDEVQICSIRGLKKISRESIAPQTTTVFEELIEQSLNRLNTFLFPNETATDLEGQTISQTVRRIPELRQGSELSEASLSSQVITSKATLLVSKPPLPQLELYPYKQSSSPTENSAGNTGAAVLSLGGNPHLLLPSRKPEHIQNNPGEKSSISPSHSKR